jgi:hypothetical protein
MCGVLTCERQKYVRIRIVAMHKAEGKAEDEHNALFLFLSPLSVSRDEVHMLCYREAG